MPVPTSLLGRHVAGPAAIGPAAIGPAASRAASDRAAGVIQAVRLAGLVTGTEAPPLPGMSPTELNRADLWATGLSPDSYPTELLRPQLEALGVVLAADLDRLADGAAVTIGGLVTHRQRPMTAKGVVFVNLEDETGLVNVICPLPVWERFGQVARSAPGLLVRGKLEKADGAINVLASRIEASPDAVRGQEPALPGLPLMPGERAPALVGAAHLAGAARARYGLTVEELPAPGLPQTRQEALEADRLDPLASYRDEFVVSPGGPIYLDGNSLGRRPRATGGRRRRLLDEWGRDLVGGWDRWADLPVDGGRPHRTVDRGGTRPGRGERLDDRQPLQTGHGGRRRQGRPARDRGRRRGFPHRALRPPGDRSRARPAPAARGHRRRRRHSRPSASPAGRPRPSSADGDVALVCLSAVNYRSGAVVDLASVTDAAHRAGALVLWDLSHAAGAVPVDLDGSGVDLAVGCSYKYLNGGPGAPAWAYVRAGLQASLRQPVWGWWGQRDQFAMGAGYDPVPNIARFLAGTPDVLGTVAVDCGIAPLLAAGMPALWAKTRRLVAPPGPADRAIARASGRPDRQPVRPGPAGRPPGRVPSRRLQRRPPAHRAGAGRTRLPAARRAPPRPRRPLHRFRRCLGRHRARRLGAGRPGRPRRRAAQASHLRAAAGRGATSRRPPHPSAEPQRSPWPTRRRRRP